MFQRALSVILLCVIFMSMLYFQGIIYEALKLVNAESSEVTLVEDTDISFGMDTTTKLVKVELVSAQRQVSRLSFVLAFSPWTS